ncbi:MAG: hypothetical protein COA97_12490 [Flavobacteriales bacterium]|nr:MAG: hypothetical protein COA97_12490 [Flavobacteriales bacterium]
MINKKILFFTFISIVLLSCSKHDDSNQGQYEVRLEFKSFHPFQLTVPVGTTVLFNNTGGGGTHTVSGSLFNSGNIKIDDSYSYTFNTLGTYFFNCFVHSNSQEQVTIKVE